MFRMTASHTARAVLLAAALGGFAPMAGASVVDASVAGASEPLDHSNSASATGSPFVHDIATTRGATSGFIPGNRNSNPTDAAHAMRSAVPETHAMAGVPNLDWGNSSSSAVDRTVVRATGGSLLAGLR